MGLPVVTCAVGVAPYLLTGALSDLEESIKICSIFANNFSYIEVLLALNQTRRAKDVITSQLGRTADEQELLLLYWRRAKAELALGNLTQAGQAYREAIRLAKRHPPADLVNEYYDFLQKKENQTVLAQQIKASLKAPMAEAVIAE